MMGFVILTAMPVASQVATSSTTGTSSAPLPALQPIKVALIEWDLPAIVDASPGAIIVDTAGHDNNRVWFVTRLGAPPRVIRFEPAKSMMKGNALWTSWTLGEVPGFTGGIRRLRASYDRRYVFVRTTSSLQRIDTQQCSGTPKTCPRVEWIDQAGVTASDVAVDDRNHVFTTAATVADPGNLATSPTQGYVQMLKFVATPAPGPGAATVTRWTVGGGAGLCGDGIDLPTSGPCLSGIAVHPKNHDLVYFSQPSGNSIGELNVYTNKARRWSLSTLGVSEPRQLHIDRSGKVWVVTGSGDVISLDTGTNKMTRHQMPDAALANPFGIAPDDDVVGYTATDTNKVGMVHPKGNGTPVYPVPILATANPFPVDVVLGRADVASGYKEPHRKVVDGLITRKTDGVFVEAQLDTGTDGPLGGSNDSTLPLGITANRGKAQGTFFYAVGANGNLDPNTGAMLSDRVGFVRLHPREKIKFPRDDDDPDDGCEENDEAHHHGEPGDNDDDGLEDGYDQSTAYERVQGDYPAPLGAAQSTEYTVTTSTTSLALIATATSDDPLAAIGIDVFDPTGLFLVASVPGPGAAVATVPLPAAGTYRVRVRNFGLSAVTVTPKLIVRESIRP
jgi:hypothetical protein